MTLEHYPGMTERSALLKSRPRRTGAGRFRRRSSSTATAGWSLGDRIVLVATASAWHREAAFENGT